MIRVRGARVLVQLPPREDGPRTTDSGLVLVRDPDLIRTPTRAIVVQVGEKSGTVDLDDVLAVLDELQDATPAAEVRDAMKALAPAGFDVQVGDCVLFSTFAALEEITFGGADYAILHESEIIGVVEPLKKDTAA